MLLDVWQTANYYDSLLKKKNCINDCLYIGIDFSPNDNDCMVVTRRNGDKTYVVNVLTNEEAREVYKKLIPNNISETTKLNERDCSKKIVKVLDKEMNTNYCYCPNCHNYLGWEHTVKSKYCSECGQKLEK